jgi:hypothetical protein
VYDALKTLLINSPAFTWIRSHDWTRNGHAAWKALLAHYKGTTEQNKIKEATYATIHNSTYPGECRGWSLENYYHAHQEAHNDLELYGELVSESRKVTDFLRGISDPLCNIAKGIVMATPNYLNIFTEAALFIASTLNIMLSNTSKLPLVTVETVIMLNQMEIRNWHVIIPWMSGKLYLMKSGIQYGTLEMQPKRNVNNGESNPKVTIRRNAMYLQLPLLILMKMKVNKRLMFMKVTWNI